MLRSEPEPLPASEEPSLFDILDELDRILDAELAEAEGLAPLGPAPPEPEDPPNSEPEGKISIREYRADLVLRVITTSSRYPKLTIGAEVQTVPALRKITRWLEYGTLYRLRLGPHFCLVFIATTPDLAQWFRDFVLPDLITERVFLFEPADLPDWLEHNPAVEPERVLLAALMRGNEDDGARLVERGLEAIGYLQESERKLHYEALMSAVGKETVMKVLERHKPKGSSPYYSWDEYIPNEVELNSYLHVTGLERGLEQGLRASLYDALEIRGLIPDAATHERIEQCHDPAQLARWHRRALTIAALEQLFEDDV
jgi:hypothetical protein